MKVCGGLTFCLLLLAPLVWAADLTPLISALRAQKFDEALKLAGDLRSQMPSDPRVLTLEGMANEGLKHQAEALNDYRSAVRVQQNYLPALKAEAQLEYAEGDPQGEATLKQIVKLDPSDQVSHAMLAAIAYRKKDCPAAIDQYRQSGEVISSRADALTQLGECLLRTKQAEQATTPLSQVVSLEPNQWRSHYNLAAAELANRQPQQAVQTLQPFLSEESIRPDILSLAAQAYETLGDTPRAISLLREAILHNPQNEANYLTFADLSFDHQSFQVGIDMLDAGLKQLPQSAKLYLARGILWGQLGNFNKAEEDFDTADRLSAGTIAGAGREPGAATEQQSGRGSTHCSREAEGESRRPHASLRESGHPQTNGRSAANTSFRRSARIRFRGSEVEAGFCRRKRLAWRLVSPGRQVTACRQRISHRPQAKPYGPDSSLSPDSAC